MGLFGKIGAPKGHQLTKAHFIFAYKHNSRHKARLVANGNVTEGPLDSVRAGVVSLRGLWLVRFLTERNGLETWVTHMVGVNLQVRTHEMVCIS